MRKLTLDKPTWLTSDLHGQHSRILELSNRPFATIEDHDNALVANLNKAVEANHALVIAGDLARSTWWLEWLRDTLVCKEVYCVVGNHDDDAKLRLVFGEHRVFERVRLKVMSNWGVRRAVVDHYPGDSWLDWSRRDGLTALLHGHSHSRNPWYRSDSAPKWTWSLDVGVDGHGYRPWAWDEIWKEMDRRLPRLQAWLDRTKESNRERNLVEQPC